MAKILPRLDISPSAQSAFGPDVQGTHGSRLELGLGCTGEPSGEQPRVSFWRLGQWCPREPPALRFLQRGFNARPRAREQSLGGRADFRR